MVEEPSPSYGHCSRCVFFVPFVACVECVICYEREGRRERDRKKEVKTRSIFGRRHVCSCGSLTRRARWMMIVYFDVFFSTEHCLSLFYLAEFRKMLMKAGAVSYVVKILKKNLNGENLICFRAVHLLHTLLHKSSSMKHLHPPSSSSLSHP